MQAYLIEVVDLDTGQRWPLGYVNAPDTTSALVDASRAWRGLVAQA